MVNQHGAVPAHEGGRMRDPYLFFVLSWVFHATAFLFVVTMLLLATQSEYKAAIVAGVVALLNTVGSDVAYNVYMTPTKRK